MIILLILLITYYFFQDKVKEMYGQAYQSNAKNGTIYYVNGIWNKVVDFQKSQENRNQESLDLTGRTKSVKDANGFYTFEIPESWTIEDGQDKMVGQISQSVYTSKGFSMRMTGGDIFYDEGAQLKITVIRGEKNDAKVADGGHEAMLLEKVDVIIGGEKIVYHKISQPRLKGGNIIDAHVLHGGNTYEIVYYYNQEKTKGAEFMFQTMMNSFAFNDKK
jgi:hypothetical protein